MIFEKIAILNFGVYAGRQVIDLAPVSRSKPIILLGGLNGGGKTTFLDALQLALYGRLATCSNRGDLAYEEFLRRSTHHGADTAGVEIEFRHSSEGQEHVFEIRRSWSVRGKVVREHLEVRRDGGLDQVLTEAWAEHVEELIPVRLSKFFFFDGEKIEALADLDRSAEVLSTAVHSLLGLDLVDQLGTDLLVLERRKRLEQKTVEEREEIAAARGEVNELRTQIEDLRLRRAGAQNSVDRAEKKLREAEERFQREGGDALERRKELEGKRDELDGRAHELQQEMLELAGEAAPLLLVLNSLENIGRDVEAAHGSAQAQQLAEILGTRDAQALDTAETAGATRKVLEVLRAFLEDDRQRYLAPKGVSSPIELSLEGRELLAGLRPQLRSDLPRQIGRLTKQWDQVESKRSEIERKLQRVPAQDAVESLVQVRSTTQEALLIAKHELARINEEIERLSREHDHKSIRLARREENEAEEHLKQREIERIVLHSDKVRQTLKVFRAAVVERHVRRIEALILDGFQHLLRKESLITDLRIDASTFAMTLFGADKRELSPARLSAGERQLLAISIIWGLARASGRRLPVIIDTPLGRLDSVHRRHLVERYFPQASHQVVLLSTDKEIDEMYYDKMKGSIGRSYHLDYDDRTGTTSIQQGYFW